MKERKTITKESSESARNIAEELQEHSAGTLGTLTPEGSVHLSVVYYTADDNFTISFTTKDETKKHNNLQKNNDVQFLVFDEKKQLTIQITGKVHEVIDSAIKEKILESSYWAANENDYNSPPLSKLYAGDTVAYQILPSYISMALFVRPQKGGYDMFETLNFENDSED